MTVTPHRAFFGDAEHDFRITPALVIELELKTGAGIGALCSRVFARQFARIGGLQIDWAAETDGTACRGNRGRGGESCEKSSACDLGVHGYRIPE